MADAILPSGSGVPGVLEAGVALELALADPSHRRVATLLRKGCARLEARVGPLTALPLKARLEALAAAEAQDVGFAWGVFREALLDFTMEAWAGHPLRAGNRDGVVWSALGLRT